MDVGRGAGTTDQAGHSWGETVITEAGNSQQVAGLVYAPDHNESTNELQNLAQPPGNIDLLSSDSSRYLWFPQGSKSDP